MHSIVADPPHVQTGQAGQIAVLACAAVVFAAFDRGLRRAPVRRVSASPLRARVVMVSSLVALVAVVWAVERTPW